MKKFLTRIVALSVVSNLVQDPKPAHAFIPLRSGGCFLEMAIEPPVLGFGQRSFNRHETEAIAATAGDELLGPRTIIPLQPRWKEGPLLMSRSAKLTPLLNGLMAILGPKIGFLSILRLKTQVPIGDPRQIGPTTDLTVTPDAKWIAYMKNSFVFVREREAGSAVFSGKLGTHVSSSPDSSSLFLSDDGRIAAVSSQEVPNERLRRPTVTFIDVERKRIYAELYGMQKQRVLMTGDAQWLFSFGSSHKVSVFSIPRPPRPQTREPLRITTPLISLYPVVAGEKLPGLLDFAINPSGHRAATLSDDSLMRIYDPNLDAPPGNNGTPPMGSIAIPKIEGAEALVLALSADGKRAATGHRDGTVRIWDLKSQKMLTVLASAEPGRSGKPIQSVIFTIDGFVAASNEEGQYVWSIQKPKRARPNHLAASSAHGADSEKLAGPTIVAIVPKILQPPLPVQDIADYLWGDRKADRLALYEKEHDLLHEPKNETRWRSELESNIEMAFLFLRDTPEGLSSKDIHHRMALAASPLTPSMENAKVTEKAMRLLEWSGSPVRRVGHRWLVSGIAREWNFNMDVTRWPDPLRDRWEALSGQTSGKAIGLRIRLTVKMLSKQFCWTEERTWYEIGRIISEQTGRPLNGIYLRKNVADWCAELHEPTNERLEEFGAIFSVEPVKFRTGKSRTENEPVVFNLLRTLTEAGERCSELLQLTGRSNISLSQDLENEGLMLSADALHEFEIGTYQQFMNVRIWLALANALGESPYWIPAAAETRKEALAKYTVGGRIQLLQWASGISTEYLAQACGVNTTTLQHWIEDLYVPRDVHRERLLKMLDVSKSLLFSPVLENAKGYSRRYLKSRKRSPLQTDA